jgi:hypothetical protein
MMKRNVLAGLMLAVFIAGSAWGQDWYHDRVARLTGNSWKPQIFNQVRSDLDHIGSARGASEKENARLERTKQELGKMQADYDQNRDDNGILNDVIDSLKKSANDERLSPRDRAVIADDVNRLHEYQQNPGQWRH